MSKGKRIRKPASLLMCLIILLSMISNAAAAEVYTIQRTVPFKDVPANHWCVKDIVKLSLRNVVAGYSNGQFYPNKPVTQIEAILLAVRNLEEEAQMDIIDSTATIPFTVPDWVNVNYRKEVLYAIQRGLIVPSENNIDASANASRAWVAQLMVRMIDKDNESSLLAEEVPEWNDAGTIPSWALGAVNVAAKYKLINGYQDNRFRPNGSITRAELVAMLSRSEQYMGLTSTANAKVNSITDSTLTILQDGEVNTVSLEQTPWVFDAKGKVISRDVLKADDMVKVMVEDGVVRYIELLPEDTVLETIKGSVLEVIPDEKVIIIKDELQKIKTISVGTGISTEQLRELKTGSKVELGLNSKGMAVTFYSQSDEVLPGNTGVITNLKPEESLLIIKNSAGKIQAYQYSPQVNVIVSGKRFPVITDLQIGDQVRIDTEAGIVTEIELIQANQELTITGKIVSLSDEKDILTIKKDDETLAAFNVDDSVELDIPGEDYPDLDNLEIDDKVELTITAGKVRKIAILDGSADSVIKGTVTAVDIGNRVITIETVDDVLKAYDVSRSVEIWINDKETTSLSSLKKDMKVELELVDDKVTYIESKDAVEGTMVSLDTGRDTIVLKVNKQNKTYELSDDPDVDIEGYSSPDLGDLDDGDYLELVLSNDVVTQINVQKIYNFEVTKVYETSKELKVIDEDDDSRYLTLDSRVKLIVPDVSYPQIDDFQKGSIVKATFMGDKLSEVEALPTIIGQVTSVNSTTNTVATKTFNGVTKTIIFNNKSEIITGSKESSVLSTLGIGNRVLINENVDGGYTIKVMSKKSGKFETYDEDTEKLRISSGSSVWESFELDDDVYVHSGTQVLDVENLIKNNQIDIYYLDDIVYEIERSN